jgi:hypothetical protein
MLNRDLATVIRASAECGNIGNIYMLTNGTYVPCDEILNAVEDNKHKVHIVINHYDINNDASELTKALCLRGIYYRLRENDGWYNFNDITYRGRTVEELKVIYDKCSFDNSDGYYYVLTDGKLNLRCGVANGILYYLKNYEKLTQDWLDIRTLSGKELTKALSDLENKGYLQACNYCVSCSIETRLLKAADDQL